LFTFVTDIPASGMNMSQATTKRTAENYVWRTEF